jgi:hypothetical protein
MDAGLLQSISHTCSSEYLHLLPGPLQTGVRSLNLLSAPMLKASLSLLVAVGLTVPPLQAQQAATPEKTKSSQKAAATPAPAPFAPKKETQASKPENSRPAEGSADASKKPGFIGRMFGKGKKEEPEATAPAQNTTPKPTTKSAPTATPKNPGAAGADTGRKAADAAVGAEGASNAAERAPSVALQKLKRGAKNTPPTQQNKANDEEGDPEELEKKRYDQAKAKATEMPEILALKEKADNASTDEESRRALRTFNRALFAKMRQLDPSIKDRADRIEAAIMKRLNDVD